MKIDTQDMISVTEVNSRGISKLVAEAMDGRTYVVMRQNRPAAVITGLEKLERMQRIEDMEQDLRLWSLAIVRFATDTGERYDLDEVAAEFGVDLDGDDD